ncbi:MAG: TA system VapC family ribonuclease toxin [Stellaceae bacterium]
MDVNLLVYAHVELLPQHRQAADWLDGRLNGIARVGLPWESLIGFLRIVTQPRIFPHPLDPAAAWAQIGEWLACAPVWIPHPTERHADVLGELIDALRPRAALIHDAHLAALAIEHGLTLCSADRDFARFPGLRWNNPIAG